MSLYRKYRPGTFAEVTGQDHVTTTLQNQIASGDISHAYLFTGPRGVGKTTSARLLAKAVNCEAIKAARGQKKIMEPCGQCAACLEIANGAALDIFEMDAASHTQVEKVRENIVESVRFSPNRLAYKVYIIDEVHMLSNHSFNALLKTLEEPPSYVIFILATTEIHKVPATIISRCQRFDFRRISAAKLVERMQGICQREKVEIEDEVLFEIARRSEGCARDAESLLDQVLALGEKKITRDNAALVLPLSNVVNVSEFLVSFLNKDLKDAIGKINESLEQGIDMTRFAEEAVDILHALLFAKMGDLEKLKENYDPSVATRLTPCLEKVTAADLARAIDLFLQTRKTMKSDLIPQLGLELATISFCSPPDFPKQEVASVSSISSRSSNLSKKPEVIPELPVLVEKTDAYGTKRIEPAPVIEAHEVILGNVPVVSLDDVKNKWPEVFAQIKANHASLPFLMQAGEISGVSGDAVEMSFQYRLHADTVNSDKNRRAIETVLSQVMGQPLRIHAKYANEESDQAVAGLLQEFGGKAV